MSASCSRLPRSFVRRVGVALALAGLALAPVAARAESAAPSTVILVSLDGTRPADLNPTDTPTLLSLASRGVRAKRLEPVVPSYTFPNHVSLATGVTPERHGIVGNGFVDAERGRFDKKEKDIPAWIEAEPIWSIAARHGVVSASYHWVGSEGTWRNGLGPRHWKKFSSRTQESEKVAQMLDWLDLDDPNERPRLITSWFHGADAAAHDHGPGSDEARRQLHGQEPAIAALVAGLEERGLFASTTLIFVSDHGMARATKVVDLNAALRDLGLARREAYAMGAGGFASVYLGGDEATATRVVALARSTGLEAHTRAEAPSEWRVDHPRFGDVVVFAPLGTAIFRSGPPVVKGFHGYAPKHESMGGIFVAVGRGVAPGGPPIALSALDVAPTVLDLLGIPVPAAMEGRSQASWLAGGPR